MNPFYQNRFEKFRGFFSINNTYPSHLHRQVELLFVLSGEIQVLIGGQKKDLIPGELSIAFPNQVHSYRTEKESLVFLLIFDSDYIEDCYSIFTESLPIHPFLKRETASPIAPESKEGFDPLSPFHPFFPSLGSHGNIAIQMLMERSRHSCIKKKEIEKKAESIHQTGNLLEKGYLSILLSAIWSSLSLSLDQAHGSDSMSERLLTYLDAHFTEPLTAKQVAKELGISYYYLSHLFSNKLQISFSRYLTGKRLALSTRLLNTTDHAVTDIAFESGFTSTRSFFRAFREEYGLSPLEYRKSIHAAHREYQIPVYLAPEVPYQNLPHRSAKRSQPDP